MTPYQELLRNEVAFLDKVQPHIGHSPITEDAATRTVLSKYLQDLAREDAVQVAFAEGGKLPQQNS